MHPFHPLLKAFMSHDEFVKACLYVVALGGTLVRGAVHSLSAATAASKPASTTITAPSLPGAQPPGSTVATPSNLYSNTDTTSPIPTATTTSTPVIKPKPAPTPPHQQKLQ